MKAAAVCFVFLLAFIALSTYLIVPYLGFVLMAMPVVMVVVGARDIWHARKPAPQARSVREDRLSPAR